MRQGLLLDRSLVENATLAVLGRFTTKLRVLSHKREKTATVRELGTLDTQYHDPSQAARELSGGNQQKLVVGRAMVTEASVLIAAHPTRGIDVGAQAAVWDEIRAARDAGMAVLLVSADLEELIGLSDRIAVLFDGEVTAQLDPDRITPAELGGYMTGVRQEEGS